jgi:hypothetical protein
MARLWRVAHFVLSDFLQLPHGDVHGAAANAQPSRQNSGSGAAAPQEEEAVEEEAPPPAPKGGAAGASSSGAAGGGGAAPAGLHMPELIGGQQPRGGSSDGRLQQGARLLPHDAARIAGRALASPALQTSPNKLPKPQADGPAAAPAPAGQAQQQRQQRQHRRQPSFLLGMQACLSGGWDVVAPEECAVEGADAWADVLQALAGGAPGPGAAFDRRLSAWEAAGPALAPAGSI